MAEYGGRHDLIEGGGDRLPRSARGIVTVFSENRREGPWVLPRLFRVLSIFGNITYMASVTVRLKPDKKKPSSRRVLGG